MYAEYAGLAVFAATVAISFGIIAAFFREHSRKVEVVRVHTRR